MAKVLWIGDAGSHTGFAKVTHSIGERLVAKGHDIEVLASTYKGDYWNTTLKLYAPGAKDPGDYYGRTRIVEMLGHGPDVIVILGDPWTHLQLLLENPYDPQQYLLQAHPIIGYLPVDGTNPPPAWSLLAKAEKRVAMSKWGQKAMPEAPVVYHGIETEVFHPVSNKTPIMLSTGVPVTSKRQCKEAFGFDPDGFLVLRVDTNSERKDYPATWKALVPVLKRHRDIQVHFHCVKGAGNHSVNLAALSDRDPATKGRFYFPDMVTSSLGWPVEDLVALINAADLFVSTSRGEGFGFTIGEAAACGVPVIAQNVSAIPEVVGPGGLLIEPQREITAVSGQDLWLADIPAFTEAIERLYLAPDLCRRLGAAARKHVQKFSWDFAADRFHDYIVDVVAHGRADLPS